MTYKVIVATNPNDLERYVNHALQDGWTVQGGIAISGVYVEGDPLQNDGDYWEYVQAMTRT